MFFNVGGVQGWTARRQVRGRHFPLNRCAAFGTPSQFRFIDFSQQFETVVAELATLVAGHLVFVNGHSFNSTVKTVKLPRHPSANHLESALDGLTVIVTGAAGSLGSAFSRLAVEKGYNTVMLDCDRRGLEAAYDGIKEAGLPEPALYPLDLAGAGPEDYQEMLSAVAEEFGGLDALVHCAARFESLTPLEQFNPSEWLMHIQVNLNSAWLLSATALPMLRESGAGRLYFMLEDMERVGGAYWGAYGVAKHALRALTSQFAAENASSGVQVLGINPGPLRSDLRSRAYHSEDPATQPDPEPAARKIIELLALF